MYTGMFQDGLIHGFGDYHWSGGMHYKGMWQNGLCHGFGTCTWKNGAKYTGDY